MSLLDGFGCCDGARDFLLKMSRMFRLFDRVTNSHLHVICDDVMGRELPDGETEREQSVVHACEI